MKCERCGRDNPEHVRFCLDCGNRMSGQTQGRPPTPAGPSVPPATSPEHAGLPHHHFGATKPSLESKPTTTQQSEAPRVSRPPAPDFNFSTTAAASNACPSCGAHNDADNRFCAACGTRLAHAAATAPSSGAKGTQLRCTRCFGSNPTSQRFCQFCGAPLADASVITGGRRADAVESPHAHLVVIAQDGTPGRRYPLTGEQADIGSQAGTVLLSHDPYVSAQHARIIYRSGEYKILDLNSVNGVYVRLGASQTLHDGDLVLIGLEVLGFQIVKEDEQRLEPARQRDAQVFGSPAVPRHSRLSQQTVEGMSRDIFFLTRTETVIGREAGDIVFTSDPFMSRRHAAIHCDPRTRTFTLRDLGSSNGTYLAIRGERRLVNGDHLRIGQHLFRLVVGSGQS